MSREILIFAGTTEGRALAEWLAEKNVACAVSVATDYGARLIGDSEAIRVLTGRMDRMRMSALMRKERFLCAVDATHPYAMRASEEIYAACRETKTPYLRLAREAAGTGREAEPFVRYVENMAEAAAFLDRTKGNILVTTGSKELPALAKGICDRTRLFARVLPSVESLEICGRCGITGERIIAMQGPFDAQENRAMLQRTRAAYLLTKESGQNGGYEEKLAAAKACGATAVVIRNPERGEGERTKPQAAGDEAEEKWETPPGRGLVSSDMDELLSVLSLMTGTDLTSGRKRLLLAGVGIGAQEYQTAALQSALQKADVIFGAKRMLAAAAPLLPDAETEAAAAEGSRQMLVPYYESDAVVDWLEAHPTRENAVVLYSGDVGFYSGAAQMSEAIARRGMSRWRVERLPGISSVSYFCAKLGVSWQDVKPLSLHGRECNLIGHLRTNGRCFLILSGAAQVREVGARLQQALAAGALKEVRAAYGYQLSYPEEEVRRVSPEKLLTLKKEGLYVLLLEHPAAAQTPVTGGVPDERFERSAGIPMTKKEVRTLSLSALQLTRQAVVYDVGAGSGSVAIEAALAGPDSDVYAIEEKPAALRLMERNRAKFAVWNMQIVEGRAPAAFQALPVPTHAFVGGSGGALEEILTALLQKNPRLRVVMNCVTLETMSEAQRILAKLSVTEPEILQISVSRAERMSGYHLLKAQNPVYIISFTGTGEAL